MKLLLLGGRLVGFAEDSVKVLITLKQTVSSAIINSTKTPKGVIMKKQGKRVIDISKFMEDL